jgi:outer membrane protein assembly factor BamB
VLPALAVGVVLATTWGPVDSEVYGHGDEGVLPAAVTKRPGLDWEWTIPGSLSGLAATGDRTYVATEGGVVTALDSGGDEVWKSDVGATGVLVAAHDHDDLVLFDNLDDDRTTALSTDDGDPLWSVDGDLQWYEDDHLYTTTDDELAAYDLGSGDRVWTTKADQTVVGEAGIYVLAGDELRRVSATDGHAVWTVDLDPSDESGPRLAVADDFVVVSGTGIAAYDASAGDRLWSEDDLAGGAMVMLFSRDEVAVTPPAFDDDAIEVALYDRDGPSGSIESDGFFYALPLRSGEHEYTLTLGTGDLYGPGHRVVATYDGGSALAAEGIYTLDDDHVSYYAYGESDAAWTLEDDFSGETVLVPGAHRLFVVQGHRLRSYS